MTTSHPSLQMRATAVRDQLVQAGKILDQIAGSLGSLRAEQSEYDLLVVNGSRHSAGQHPAADLDFSVDGASYPTVTQLRARSLIKDDAPELEEGIPARDFDELADVISLRSIGDDDLSEEEKEFEQRFSEFARGDVDDASRRWFTGS